MAYEMILVETQGRVGIITLNRPQAATAPSRSLVADLGAPFGALGRDPTVTAVILTGAGDRAFCAGADLKERRGMTLEQTRAFLVDLNRLVDDVAATAEYYRDLLGFEVEFLWGDEPIYGRVIRDDAVLDFVRSEPPGRRNSVAAAGATTGADALIVVGEVEDGYMEIQEKAEKVLERLAPREYGMLDCMIEDLNGYRLTIGGGIEGEEDEET